ncbi:MAG: recombinase family protein [Eubacteriales bacterium]
MYGKSGPRHTVHRTPESEWDIAYHTHDPIITEELFNQVQEINRSRADAYNANYGACSHLPKGDNPYRERLVSCGLRDTNEAISQSKQKP